MYFFHFKMFICIWNNKISTQNHSKSMTSVFHSYSLKPASFPIERITFLPENLINQRFLIYTSFFLFYCHVGVWVWMETSFSLQSYFILENWNSFQVKSLNKDEFLGTQFLPSNGWKCDIFNNLFVAVSIDFFPLMGFWEIAKRFGVPWNEEKKKVFKDVKIWAFLFIFLSKCTICCLKSRISFKTGSLYRNKTGPGH